MASPYPNPFLRIILASVEVEQSQRVRFEVLDLGGMVIEVLADTIQERGRTYQYQWWPSDDILPGVYQFRAVGEFVSLTNWAVHSEVGGGMYLNGHLVMSLGQTDANGALVVDDSTRFPFLYDSLSEVERTTESGNVLGVVDLGREVTIILENEDGWQRGFLRTLADSGNVFELVWN